jgi:two-component system chemotaxis family response regulator WspR
MMSTSGPEQSHQAARPSHQSAVAEQEYRFSVLLIDDQLVVQEKVRRAVRPETDIDFHFCGKAADALAKAEACQPTVILQDLVMPDADGLDLVRQYRSSPLLANVPVIVLSSTDEPLIKKDAFLAGANDYVVKSYDTIELVARIRYHSRSYINLLQRDAAYAALHESRKQLEASNAELKRLTHTDGLTGIANRRYFDDYMKQEWLRAQREKTPLSLLLMDVDCFKLYNDTYGHVAGDDVLRRVGAAIAAGAGRPADLAARYGGEEFAVILPNTDSAGTKELAEKICRAVAALGIAHATSKAVDHVTVSVGAATAHPVQGGDIVGLIKRVDDCLYSAKQSGRNRVSTAE